MTNPRLSRRLANKWRRLSVDRFGRRPFTLQSDVPFVSFTFDDFPRSAYTEGGRILAEHGARGTYFTSCRLLGQPSPSGRIASRDDLPKLLQDGHELGCHTFEHLDGTRSAPAAFERSIAANRASLAETVPDADLPAVFAYPLDGPVLSVKKAVGQHFAGCRGGGQTCNGRVIDLNLLKAYFFDWKNRDDVDGLRKVLAETVAARGWLIFATHDVAAAPSDYGCTPQFFSTAVRLAIESGAHVRPMMQACRELGIVSPPRTRHSTAEGARR
jgi:peptidoglycan/xylan/chitin deacetylase (PgdA/CDA1 family)